MIGPPWVAVIGKFLLATVLGGAVGIDRELAGKPAGLRTNILICLGAALFTHLSIVMGATGMTADGRPTGDTTRIAAQIVSGIGFLGAGAILHGGGQSGGGVVVGLTTAATIWVVAAIGAATGAGLYGEAVGGTGLLVAILVGLRPVERALAAKRRRVHATLRVKPGGMFETFEKIVVSYGIHVNGHRTFEHDTDRTFELDLSGATKQYDLLVDRLHKEPGVISIVTE